MIIPMKRIMEDCELGECSPSFVGTIVMNQSNNGWTDWKNEKGVAIDVYRQASKAKKETEQ